MEAELVTEAIQLERVVLIDEPNLSVSYIKRGAGSVVEGDFFKRGLLWAHRQIANEERLCVDVRRLDFNYCDFQPEILFFLSAGWLLQTGNNQELKFDWSYDKAANRYNFVFPDEQ